ncbi:hypothetical protein [Nitrospirillum viridazoti]|uniref:Uncharacterized protein n=2 Tax=Nitrospirillum TaxID=1543705 RepID=A0A248JQH0_9PROT|nr:hypothetical protein [Nitrospirillum amazonense]ASG20849.1 hypothetical protein Y958_08520 [Nitrospirillum amazonense CBAmc]TWB37808.1 hypothetical protein FBZ91_107121 [Nitrospirillum amazonense]TWB63311.1 hypothetical protein FBZ92_10465 [Nitrospirillum amazonense]
MLSQLDNAHPALFLVFACAAVLAATAMTIGYVWRRLGRLAVRQSNLARTASDHLTRLQRDLTDLAGQVERLGEFNQRLTEEVDMLRHRLADGGHEPQDYHPRVLH